MINEDYVFQFINNDRVSQVADTKKLLNDGGVFVTSEKFHTANEAANEAAKYAHQEQYFTQDDLTEDKQTIVSGMADDMVNDVEYANVLADNFKYVTEFWNSGNFKGFIASDSKANLQEFLKEVGPLESGFRDNENLIPKESSLKKTWPE